MALFPEVKDSKSAVKMMDEIGELLEQYESKIEDLETELANEQKRGVELETKLEAAQERIAKLESDADSEDAEEN